MSVKVLRLHELTKRQVNRLAAFLKHTIHTEKSGYVCQGHPRLGDFGGSYRNMLQKQSEASALPSLNVDRWIALEKNKPVGICCVSRGIPDRTITLFLVDPKLSIPEQLKVADAMVLQGCKDILADPYGKGKFISYSPNNSLVERYAELCRWRVVEVGPLATEREIGIKELRDNVLERQ